MTVYDAETRRQIATDQGRAALRSGWFTYFHIHGPEYPAFDGSWKPGDLEEVK